jgi:hypothetical protein
VALDPEYFLVTGESKFFVKTPAYVNAQKLMQAKAIAT